MKKIIVVLSITIIIVATSIIINTDWDKKEVKNISPEPQLNSIILVQQVRELARLETVSITMERVIQEERSQDTWFGVFGEKLLFVAYGEVIAGVDLKKIQDGDFEIVNTDTVRVRLPQSEILTVTLDNERSYVFEHEKGILTDKVTSLESEVRLRAQKELKTAALESEILELANKIAQYQVSELLHKMGAVNVEFTDKIPEKIKAVSTVNK